MLFNCCDLCKWSSWAPFGPKCLYFFYFVIAYFGMCLFLEWLKNVQYCVQIYFLRFIIKIVVIKNLGELLWAPSVRVRMLYKFIHNMFIIAPENVKVCDIKMKAWLCVIRNEKYKGAHIGVSMFCSVYFTEKYVEMCIQGELLQGPWRWRVVISRECEFQPTIKSMINNIVVRAW